MKTIGYLEDFSFLYYYISHLREIKMSQNIKQM